MVTAEPLQLDVVIPVFNESEIIDQLHRRVEAACIESGLRYRIIYVDDGSADQTAKWLLENAVDEPASSFRTSQPACCLGQVKLICLSRNFGQPAAIMAGLEASTADCVVLMDGDLQDPPELIPELVAQWRRGNEVVIARRTGRKETLLRGLGFRLFHTLFGYISDSKIPSNTGTFCLMDREAVEAVCRLPESHRFFPGLRAWVGFQQSLVEYERPERAGGEPKQTFSRLLRYAMDALFGYSLKPLRLVTGAGVGICTLSFIIAMWFVFKRLAGLESASIGFTTITCAVIGLGGFQLVAMGVLGEYIGRIYDEVKRRPAFVVAREFESNTRSGSSNHPATIAIGASERKAG